MASSEHNRLYLAATDLLDRDRVIHLTPPASVGWFARRRIRKAIFLLKRVVELNPANWAALWVMGKAYQALGDHENALAQFSRSRDLNGEHADIAREAAISAVECGRPELGIEFTRAALRIKPGDAGLLANLGLAHLFAGEPKVAREILDASLQANPDDSITHSVSCIVDEVLANKRTCPRTFVDIA